MMNLDSERCSRRCAQETRVWVLGAVVGAGAACQGETGPENGSGTETGPSTTMGTDGGTGTDSGGTPATDLPPGDGAVGSITITIVDGLPGNGMVASAWDDFFTPIRGRANFQIPRGMYVASCNRDSERPKFLLSYTVESGNSEDPPQEEWELDYRDRWWHGAMLEAEYVPGTGLSVIQQVGQPDCQEMNGIAVAPDCSFVGAICMKPLDASLGGGFTKDLVASYVDPDSLTQARNGGTFPEELWLAEWPSGDILSDPNLYVVHKAAGSSWHYMNYRLTLGDDNTYGMLTKAYRGGHEGASLLVVDRGTYEFVEDRTHAWGGYMNAGHPTNGALTYNPATSSYATHCGGDWDEQTDSPPNTPHRGAYIEGHGKSLPLYRTLIQGVHEMGGPGGLLPMPDGSYLLAFTTVPDEPEFADLFGSCCENEGDSVWDARTVVGLMRIDSETNIVCGALDTFATPKVGRTKGDGSPT